MANSVDAVGPESPVCPEIFLKFLKSTSVLLPAVCLVVDISVHTRTYFSSLQKIKELKN